MMTRWAHIKRARTLWSGREQAMVHIKQYGVREQVPGLYFKAVSDYRVSCTCTCTDRMIGSLASIR